MVFVVSALFHEWIIFGAIRFWYPVLLLMFGGPGVIFMQYVCRMSHVVCVCVCVCVSV